MKKYIVIPFICILSTFNTIISFIVCYVVFLQPSVTIDKNFSNYEKYLKSVIGASDLMPKIEDIVDYENIFFSYKEKNYKLFYSKANDRSYGMNLIIKYDEYNYSNEKNYILSNYNFIDGPQIRTYSAMTFDGKDIIGTDYIFPLDSFDYNGFTFKICPNNHFWSVEHTSESFVMIGFDEKSYSICYLYFFCYDYDYICDTEISDEQKIRKMTYIIKEYFYWPKKILF